MKKIFTICLISLLLCGCNNKEETKETSPVKNNNITCSEKDKLIKEGAILIDVRTEEEYASYHLDGAINIPVDEILDGVMALDLENDALIIVYCQSGNRSIGAYRELTNNGYENVYDLGAISNCNE